MITESQIRSTNREVQQPPEVKAVQDDRVRSDRLTQTNLSRMLIAFQQKYDVDGKTLAVEIGIGEPTLTRIRQGHRPDAIGLAKIISWLVESSTTTEGLTTAQLPQPRTV